MNYLLPFILSISLTTSTFAATPQLCEDQTLLTNHQERATFTDSFENQNFSLYYISKHNNNCGFYGITDESRETVIDQIHDKIFTQHSVTTKSLLKKAIVNDNGYVLTRVFGDNKPNHYRNVSDAQCERYLQHYKNSPETIEFIGNYNRYGDRIHERQSPAQYTLLDVIAYTYQKNLNVFQEINPNENNIFRVHQFRLRGSNQLYPTVNLLYKDNHYSLLLPETASQREKEQAAINEQNYLDLDALEQRQLELENARAIAALNSEDLNPQEGTHCEQTDLPSVEQEPESEQESEIRSHSPRGSSSLTTAALDTDAADERTINRRTHRRIRNELALDINDINEFIDHRRSNLTDRSRINVLSYQQSKNHALAYFIRQQGQHLDPQDRIKNLFSRVRLYLEHNAIPESARNNQNQYRNALLTEVKDIIRRYKSSKNAKLKRFAHYGYIFAGRLLTQKGEYAQAYEQFKSVGKAYTKTYYIDIAGLIIDHNFRPHDITEDPLVYAKTLLDYSSPSAKKAYERSHSNHIDEEMGAKPQYLNRKLTNRDKNRLKANLRERQAQNHSTTIAIATPSTRVDISSDHDPSQGRQTHIRRQSAQVASTRTYQRMDTTRSEPMSGSMSGSKAKKHTVLGKRSGHETPEKHKRKPIVISNATSKDVLIDSKNADIDTGTNTGSFDDEMPDTPSNHNSSRLPDTENQTDSSEEENAEEIFGKNNNIRNNIHSFFMQARQARRDHNYEKQIQLIKQAHKLAKENQQMDLQAMALIKFGDTLHLDEAHPSNADWYLDALHILGKNGDANLRARAYLSLGNLRYKGEILGETVDGGVCYTKTLDLLDESTDITLRVKTYISLGNIGYTNPNHPSLTDWYLHALDLLRDNDDRNLKAQIYIGLGHANFTNEEHPSQKDWYLHALNLLGNYGDTSIRAKALIYLGNAKYTDNNNFHRTQNYLRALDLLGENGDTILKVKAYLGLGNSRFNGNINGKLFTETDCYKKALELLGDHDHKKLRAQIYINLGNIRYTDQTHLKDTDWYLLAIDLLDDNNDQILKSQAYIGLGNAKFTNENHHSSKDWFIKVLDLLGENGNITLRAQACIGLGNERHSDRIHRSQKDWYLEALNLLGKNGDKKFRAQACIALGNTRYVDKTHPKSAVWYLHALDLLNDKSETVSSNKTLKAQVYIGLGNTHFEGRIYGKMFTNADCYKKALEILGNNATPTLRTQIYLGLGNASCSNRNNKQALNYFEKALRLAPTNTLKRKAQDGIDRANRFLKLDHTKNHYLSRL